MKVAYSIGIAAMALMAACASPKSMENDSEEPVETSLEAAAGTEMADGKRVSEVDVDSMPEDEVVDIELDEDEEAEDLGEPDDVEDLGELDPAVEIESDEDEDRSEEDPD